MLAVVGTSVSVEAQVARVKPRVFFIAGDGNQNTLRPAGWPHEFISRHAR